jgi:hypothetical protein
MEFYEAANKVAKHLLLFCLSRKPIADSSYLKHFTSDDAIATSFCKSG